MAQMRKLPAEERSAHVHVNFVHIAVTPSRKNPTLYEVVPKDFTRTEADVEWKRLLSAYESPAASHLMINEVCERSFREEMATMSFVEFEAVVCEKHGGMTRPRTFYGLEAYAPLYFELAAQDDYPGYMSTQFSSVSDVSDGERTNDGNGSYASEGEPGGVSDAASVASSGRETVIDHMYRRSPQKLRRSLGRSPEYGVMLQIPGDNQCFYASSVVSVGLQPLSEHAKAFISHDINTFKENLNNFLQSSEPEIFAVEFDLRVYADGPPEPGTMQTIATLCREEYSCTPAEYGIMLLDHDHWGGLVDSCVLALATDTTVFFGGASIVGDIVGGGDDGLRGYVPFTRVTDPRGGAAPSGSLRLCYTGNHWNAWRPSNVLASPLMEPLDDMGDGMSEAEAAEMSEAEQMSEAGSMGGEVAAEPFAQQFAQQTCEAENLSTAALFGEEEVASVRMEIDRMDLATQRYDSQRGAATQDDLADILGSPGGSEIGEAIGSEIGEANGSVIGEANGSDMEGSEMVDNGASSPQDPPQDPPVQTSLLPYTGSQTMTERWGNALTGAGKAEAEADISSDDEGKNLTQHSGPGAASPERITHAFTVLGNKVAHVMLDGSKRCENVRAPPPQPSASSTVVWFCEASMPQPPGGATSLASALSNTRAALLPPLHVCCVPASKEHFARMVRVACRTRKRSATSESGDNFAVAESDHGASSFSSCGSSAHRRQLPPRGVQPRVLWQVGLWSSRESYRSAHHIAQISCDARETGSVEASVD